MVPKILLLAYYNITLYMVQFAKSLFTNHYVPKNISTHPKLALLCPSGQIGMNRDRKAWIDSNKNLESIIEFSIAIFISDTIRGGVNESFLWTLNSMLCRIFDFVIILK